MTLVPLRRNTGISQTYKNPFDDFDRIFDNFFRNAVSNTSMHQPSISALQTPLDVHETDNAYVIEAELPGLGKDDIALTVEDGVLTISGEKQDLREESEGKTYHRVERLYGQFKRVLQLPKDAAQDNVEAEMAHGVLRVTIPKTPEAKKEAKYIPIKVKKG